MRNRFMAVLLIGAAAGCLTVSALVLRGTGSSGASDVVASLSQPLTVGRGALTLVPPPANMTPGISQVKALEILHANGGGGGASEQVFLALAPGLDREGLGKGSDTLVWVSESKGYCVIGSGGAIFQNNPQPPCALDRTIAGQGVNTVVIDAMTGEFIADFESGDQDNP
jgi:hypothetical protein